jgi:hypothetical protein
VEKNIVVWSRIRVAAIFVASTMLSLSAARAEELSQILRGYEIAPVNLNLAGKDWILVGLGSYLVNTTGCNDCHTHPNWEDKGNPYLGQPEQINTEGIPNGRADLWAGYLANRRLCQHNPRQAGQVRAARRADVGRIPPSHAHWP